MAQLILVRGGACGGTEEEEEEEEEGGGWRWHCASIEQLLIQASEKETSPSYPLINGIKTNENSVPGNLYVKYMLMFMCQDE